MREGGQGEEGQGVAKGGAVRRWVRWVGEWVDGGKEGWPWPTLERVAGSDLNSESMWRKRRDETEPVTRESSSAYSSSSMAITSRRSAPEFCDVMSELEMPRTKSTCEAPFLPDLLFSVPRYTWTGGGGRG